MKYAQLARIRLIVPGTLILLLAAIMVSPSLSFSDVQSLGDSLVKGGFVVFAIGALYRIARVRRIPSNYSLQPINENIDKRLLAIYTPPIPDERLKLLCRGGHVRKVFYKIVDNDKTLSFQAERIFANGAVLTSIIDACIVGLAGWGLTFSALLATQNYAYEKWFLSWTSLVTVSYLVLLPLTEHQHLSLSNGQLDFIAAHHTQEVISGINSAVAALPS